MAGAFSGHLVNTFQANPTSFSAPFSDDRNHIVTSGPMSFNASMHGASNMSMGNTSMADSSFAFNSSFFGSDMSDATTLKIAALQAKLNQKLGPEYISQRPGPGGGPKLTYAEGWKIINLANEVFGFNGWSSNVISLTTDFIDFNEESRRYTVGTTAIIRVTLRDGVYHEDIGYGMLENSKSKGGALDKCKKEAVTDGLKRALRNFGNLLGNCLYDKSYTQEVIKIKVPPPKFDKNELHRRPEFEESKPNVTSASTPSKPQILDHINTTIQHPIAGGAQTPQHTSISSIPSHMRSLNSNTNSTPAFVKGKAPVRTGLNTPITTPAHNSTIMVTRHPPPDRKPIISNTTNTGRSNNGHNYNKINAASPSTSTNKPPPPAPPPVKEVEVAVEADESFNFYSDDDALLALVDLGEGDLGQPVLPETDMGRPIGGDVGDDDFGRPIDLDEGLGETSMQEEHTSMQDPGPSRGGGHPVSDINAQRGSGVGMLSKLLPQQNQYPNQSRAPAQRALNTTNNHAQPSRIQDQNRHPQSSSGSVTKRPVAPSMGGFHFPPGMNPLQQQQSRLPPQALGQSSGSGIGLKRPSDAMSGPTTTAGAKRPGMGLDTHTGPDTNTVKREVFARLDGEGGEIKRVRR